MKFVCVRIMLSLTAVDPHAICKNAQTFDIANNNRYKSLTMLHGSSAFSSSSNALRCANLLYQASNPSRNTTKSICIVRSTLSHMQGDWSIYAVGFPIEFWWFGGRDVGCMRVLQYFEATQRRDVAVSQPSLLPDVSKECEEARL